jgi:hypothetical protein
MRLQFTSSDRLLHLTHRNLFTCAASKSSRMGLFNRKDKTIPPNHGKCTCEPSNFVPDGAYKKAQRFKFIGKCKLCKWLQTPEGKAYDARMALGDEPQQGSVVEDPQYPSEGPADPSLRYDASAPDTDVSAPEQRHVQPMGWYYPRKSPLDVDEPRLAYINLSLTTSALSRTRRSIQSLCCRPQLFRPTRLLPKCLWPRGGTTGTRGLCKPVSRSSVATELPCGVPHTPSK